MRPEESCGLPFARHPLSRRITLAQPALSPVTSIAEAPRIIWPLLALALGSFGIGTTEFVSMGLLPDIARGIGTSIPVTGHVISAYALGVVVGAPVFAGLGVKMRRRTLLIALMVMFTIGNTLTAFATGYNTLLAARFLAGLPHGAYFGVASVVAAALAGPTRRAWAVARVLLGLTVANVVGVPAATWLGQALGWRSAFIAVGCIGLLTMLALFRWLPSVPADAGSSLRSEVRALGRTQIWLTLGIAAIGFGGMFAVYSYISPTLTNLAGMSAAKVPLVLAVWGVGMVAGNLAGGWLADRGAMRAMAIALVATAASLALFTVTSSNAISATATAFLLGSGLAIAPALQLRLMDLAPDAQSLTAALMHSAFNAANAIGPWLGGMVLAAGFGWRAPAWVGVALAVAGLAILGASALLQRATNRRTADVAALPESEPEFERATAA